MRKEKEFYKRESTYLRDIDNYIGYIEDMKDEIIECEKRIKRYERSLKITRIELEEFRDFKKLNAEIKEIKE